MKKNITIYTFAALLSLPFLAQAQLEKTGSVKQDSTAKTDSLPQVLTFSMVIFPDSTWGKGGQSVRMVKTESKAGTMPRVYQSIDNVQTGDLICEYFNTDATIVVREVLKNPLQQYQQEAAFSLKIPKELKAVKLEIRRVRRDHKTEKLGSFKLIKPFGE